MKRREAPAISPLGTAAQRFARLGRGKPANGLNAFFRRVAAAARDHDLGDDSLYLAEELVRLQWSLGPRERRALALLVLAALISVRQGSTRLPLDTKVNSYLGKLVKSLAAAAQLDDSPSALLRDINRIAEATTLEYLVGRAGEYRPLIMADGCVYQHRMLWCEDQLAARLRDRIGGSTSAELPGSDDVDTAMAEVLARPAYYTDDPAELSAEQVDAVTRAVQRPFTVVSGGPGTGKTAIIVSMLRVLARLGTAPESIALAAPTGKAANRMAGAIRSALAAVRDPADVDTDLAEHAPSPRTLHRLLGYMPSAERFRHHENNPLPVSMVIVDEASMIDLVLAERLVRAVPPTARLILLGDADQLPSVDAGAVLRDLVSTESDLATRLTHSFRMDVHDPAGRAILTAARELNAGKISAFVSARRTRADALTYHGVELLDTRKGTSVQAFVDAWYRDRIASQPEFERLTTKVYRYDQGQWAEGDDTDLAALSRIYESNRLLTVTRRFSAGSEAINRRLHDRIIASASVDYQPDFYPGEPVLMRHNDYDRGLFNGDQGIVVRVSEDGGDHHYRVVFPRVDGYSVFHLDSVRAHIEVAFAVTVHKSQGSEYDHISLVLPQADLPLLTREMIYTGVTRARSSVVIVGDAGVLKTGALRSVDRFSGLADKLYCAHDVVLNGACMACGTRDLDAVAMSPKPVSNIIPIDRLKKPD
jgi:exodeoxyribonuclease V alpha subunit